MKIAIIKSSCILKLYLSFLTEEMLDDRHTEREENVWCVNSQGGNINARRCYFNDDYYLSLD